ncbi:putative ubiquitin specific protease [Kockovaella imperatae]|uniref:Putative ubiquitin specific protease n=1 Tax=Kockovaella imperatae TaxID=4999 RepID=A0A1Y1ULJ0_9TREE|nr:putative ubiquitin specific protease [Kockovaella imperatae]ORX38918.1 putative ubiquitin specific protease [Kockovaella imperatae]
MSVPSPNRQGPSHRIDTSICPHLRSLIGGATSSSANDGETTRAGGASAEQRCPVVMRRFVQVVRWGATDQGIKRRKTSAPACHSCSSPLSRPFACLTCDFVGCISLTAGSSSSSKQCMNEHWRKSEGKCAFAVDSSSGAIFCSACNDLIYADTFEDLYRVARIRVEEENDKSREQGSIVRGRGPWMPWKAIADSASRQSAPCNGLRPLLNLSQTCFLSAILQAFIHNPLFKAYFLSDRHNRHVCANGSGIGKLITGPDGAPSTEREKGCMCCEMDRAFEEFHNHDKAPFGPITMLYAMWHASAELEGYGQQDAHSFFLAALEQIHTHAKGQLSSCNCIAHQAFLGSLSSSVTCSNCKTTSTTDDPILDVQLDFPSALTEGHELTLAAMLRRYCSEEKVGDHGRGYDCSSCGGGQGVVATKKLCIKKLAPVLSFQLKRFAHNATSSKIEHAVKFPSHLNMRPFVDTTISSPDGSKQVPSTPGSIPLSVYDYDLFAVVTHEGKLDNGHYWADVWSNGEWWHCDDDKVTRTTLSQVLAQNAYMLFYVKRSLSYAQPHSKLLNHANGDSVNGHVPNSNSSTGIVNGGRIAQPAGTI